jgi:tRNA (mo5U34)-methyltransferase
MRVFWVSIIRRGWPVRHVQVRVAQQSAPNFLISRESPLMPTSPTNASGLSRIELQAAVEAVGFWWHSIDLGQGVVTPGAKTATVIQRELQSLRLPNLNGKSVLDIGAYDGYYSFAAERRNAARVVALDHFAWAIDLPAAARYRQDCRRRGIEPQPVEQTPNWQPTLLPGKRGFDTARRALRSNVEVVVDEFMTMDLTSLGAFDVTLYLGVLYHMQDPLGSLRRLASVTRELAVIETHAIALPGYEHLELCQFYSSSQLNRDPSNWWGPNLNAILGMCSAAGFSRVEVVAGRIPEGAGPRLKQTAMALLSYLTRRPYYFRAVIHAWK